MPINYIKKIIRANKDRPFFPGQEKGEKVIFFTRRHPLSFLGSFLFVFFMAIIPFLFYLAVSLSNIIQLSASNEKIVIVLAGSYLLFVLGFFLAAWIDYYMDVMILTDSRIVDITQNVLFSRTVSEANLNDIEDVNAEVKGVLPTFFHYGTVFVQTAGTARNFEFKSIPNPYNISKMVVDLHQKSLLEQEEREAGEIGKSILNTKKDGQDVTREECEKAAHELARRHKQSPSQPIPKEKEDSQNSQYQESSGWKEIDRTETPKDNNLNIPPPPKTKETPKPETEPEDDNSISHDDLEKGGGSDF